MPARILIIGGVAAGATAAAKARRIDEHARITLLERGPFVSFANCGLPYFISRDIEKRSVLLLQTPEGFMGRYRVDVRLHTEATGIDRARKVVTAQTPNGPEEFPYDKLILAQGGNPIEPPIPGKDQGHVFKLWTVPDMDRIDGFLSECKPTTAVIAGGGFIGLEMAEALVARGLRVTLVELGPHVMGTMDQEFAAMVQATLAESGVEVVTGAGVSSISAGSVTLSDGREIDAGLVLLSVGVRPNLALATQAGLALGPAGALAVDQYLRTSDPDILAGGDMVEITHKLLGKAVRLPLAGPANRQGRIAAMNALGANVPYHGALGTSVVKVFDQTAAQTGLTEKTARAAGLEVGVSYVFKDHHASYYPGATPIALKLVFELKTGRLLGGQAYGANGVDKRIDVLATALHGRMTLDDLAELDLAYAPPYSSANDPVNMAAFVGQNHLSGFSLLRTPLETVQALEEGTGFILDVRTMGEQGRDPLNGVMHIPADEIRDRLTEVPRDQAIYLLSKDGFLGHLALRTLVAEGFAPVYNIAGGFAALKWFA